MIDLSTQIEKIRRVSLNPRFLQGRVDAETEARDLLIARVGRFTEADLDAFLDLCNTEVVPPGSSDILRDSETRTRFQQSFFGQNKIRMLASLDECNDWIARLWKAAPDDIASTLDAFWQSPDAKGAGTGLPTMVLYLRNPELHAVWLASLSDALASIWNVPLDSKRNAVNYFKYNEAVTQCLRIPYGVKPQEIDYILFRLSKKNEL